MNENGTQYGLYVSYLENPEGFRISTDSITETNWDEHFYAILNILKDYIDDETLPYKKINILIGGHEVRLTIFDYFINLIMWSLIIKAEDKIEGKHIFFYDSTTANSIKNFIDKNFIIPHSKDMNLIKMNNLIADMLYYMAFIDDFAFIFVNSINIQDDIAMMEADKEYYDILHPNIDGISISEAKDNSMESIYKLEEKIKKSKKILGYDHAYTNAFRAQESINLKQLKEYTNYIGTKPDGKGNVVPYIIDKSFINGGVTDTAAYFIESASGRTAQVLSKMNVGKSGAMARKMGQNNLDTRLCQDPNHKCNTANFIKLHITDKKTFSRLTGRWYRLSETGFDNVISVEDTFLIGKTIYLRSPITCADHAHGEGICRYCYGELYFINKNINVGKYAAEELTSALTQRLLSAKHLLDTNIDKINFPDIFKSYFTFDDNAVVLIDDKTYDKNVYIILDPEEVSMDNEDDIEDVSEEEITIYNEHVSTIELRVDDIITTIEVPEIQKLYLSKALTSKLNKGKRNSEDKIEIQLSKWDRSDPLFYIAITNNELSEAMNRIKNIIDKSAVTTSFTKDEIVQELNSTVIKGGINLMSVHLEVLLSNQIRSVNDILEKPNWSNVNEPYKLIPLSKALMDNPSITVSLNYEKIAKQFKSPLTYRKYKPSVLDPFYQEQPQVYMDREFVDDSFGDDVTREVRNALLYDEDGNITIEEEF